MSIHAIVYFQRRGLPSSAAWNQALAQLRWNVRFAPGLDVNSASGFQRAIFYGRRTGAEMYFGDVSAADVARVGPAAAKTDRQVQFSFSYELEMAFVLAASFALCALAAGIYVDPQAGKIVSQHVLRGEVNSMIARAPRLAGPEW